MGIYGQDWSAYQAASPSTSGIDYVFLKVTEGLTYESPRWKSQYAAATKAGLVVGFYHYPHMHNNDRAEADYFLSKVSPKPGELVVLDWEGYDNNNSTVPMAQQRAFKDDYLKYMKSKLPHNPVGMYCNTSYWLNVDTSNYFQDFLWIATAGKPAGSPGIKAKWTFHQYSTAGGVDHDYSTFDSRMALKIWALSFAPEKVQTTGDNMAITQADANLIAKTVLNLDGVITAPADDPNVKTNPYWVLQSYLKDSNQRIRVLETEIAALKTSLSSASTSVVDVNALAEAVVKAIGKDLSS